MKLPFPSAPSPLATALTLVLTAGGAPSAAAQVGVSDTIPNNFTINADDCESDEESTFRYTLAFDGTLQAAWSIRLYEDLTACPALYVFEPDYIMTDWQEGLTPVPTGNKFFPTDTAAQERTAKEIFGPEICGGAKGNYIVCLYMTDIVPDLSSETPVLDQNLILVPPFPINAVVDSERPNRPRISAAVAGNERVTLELEPVTDGEDDTVRYAIQYRSCVDLGGTTGGSDDAGVLNLDAGTVASECDAPGAFILSEQDDLIITSLVNDIEYEFRVAAIDNLDNVSTFSALVTASPSTGLTPNGVYNGEPNPLSVRPPDSCDPGKEAEEGCAQSTARHLELKFFALALGVAAFGRRRRRKKEAC